VTVTLGGPSCQTNDVGNVIKLTSPSGTATISGPMATGNGGTATFTVSDMVPETVVLTATDTTCGKTLAQTGSVTFTASEANQSSVAVSPASTPASGPGATLYVTLRTSTGAPIIGEAVHVPPAGNATVTPEASSTAGPPGFTNSSGIAEFLVTDPTVEPVTLAAYDGTTELYQMATVNFTGSEANQSTISTNPQSEPAVQTANPITVTVTLKNAGGVAIGGDSVSLSANSSNVSISPAVTTNANGVAMFTVTDSNVETVVLSALDRTTGVTLVQTATVTFTANEQNQSTITTSATTVQARKLATITVTLLSAPATPIVGHVVTLTASPSTNVTITPAKVTTNASGQAQFNVTSSSTQAVTFSATDTTAGSTLYKTVSVTWAKA
jgi:hypothetical protein